MKNPSRLNIASKEFWSSTSQLVNFPRDIESAVLWGLPLAIVKIPFLGLDSIQAWLGRNYIEVPPLPRNRRVRACLVARQGVGIIFVDGADPEDEIRFSIAHEAAHFILDYQQPRQRAIERFGLEITEVLDGVRQATIAEKLSGVLSGVKVGPFAHTLNRNTTKSLDCDLCCMEDNADLLALELLAPLSDVTKLIKAHKCLATALCEGEKRYGIPARFLESYFKYVMTKKKANKTFKEWLGRYN